MSQPSELTGRFGRVIEQVRAAVAASAKFQEWTGTASAAEALGRVYETLVAPDDAAEHPFCIVQQGDQLSARRAAHDHLSPYATGDILVTFYDVYDPAAHGSLRAALRAFRNTVAGQEDAAVVDSYDGVMTEVEAAIAASFHISEIRALPPAVEFQEVTGRGDGTEFEWTFVLHFEER